MAKDKRAYSKEYYRKNKHRWKKRTADQQGRYNADRREKYASDAEYRKAAIAKVSQYRLRNLEKIKAKKRKDAYDLDDGEYRARLLAQGGKCKLCKQTPRGKGAAGSLCVDHCHLTGRVRGLLCQKCNHAIGLFNDDPELIRLAAEYVDNYRF